MSQIFIDCSAVEGNGGTYNSTGNFSAFCFHNSKLMLYGLLPHILDETANISKDSARGVVHDTVLFAASNLAVPVLPYKTCKFFFPPLRSQLEVNTLLKPVP